MMRLAIGSDHAGYEMKQQVIERLREADYDVTDCGTHSTESVDYPDYAAAVAARLRGVGDTVVTIISGISTIAGGIAAGRLGIDNSGLVCRRFTDRCIRYGSIRLYGYAAICAIASVSVISSVAIVASVLAAPQTISLVLPLLSRRARSVKSASET